MPTNIHESFLQLVRLGIGHIEGKDNKAIKGLSSAEWVQLKALADEQGLSAVVLDALNMDGMNLTDSMPLEVKLEWIGETLQEEAIFASQQKEAAKMAALFHQNHIRTYVLKGVVVAECYPKPNHRLSVDLDCFLSKDVQGLKGLSSSIVNEQRWDAWALGNYLIASKGFEVSKDFYKNSTFLLPGLTVENHQYLTPFRGNKNLKALEKVLQACLRKDKGENRFEGTWLFRPPVIVSTLFLIEHAYSHFLHEGLTWRMVLDWKMFSKKYEDVINWSEFEAYIDEFGFRKFYDSFSRLGQYLIGEGQDSPSPSSETSILKVQDKLMLEDIWAHLDLHETVRGLKGKLALAGNTWRARWKYRYFTEMSWVTALWIQTKGFLFEKNPKLR